MKITDRPVSFCRRTTARTFSARFAGQRGGHLVEQQNIRLDGQGTREIEDAKTGERDLPRGFTQIEVRYAQFAHPVEERRHGRIGEPQVGSNVEVGINAGSW
jgi:hypothetical protein